MKCFRPDCEKEATLGLQLLLCRGEYAKEGYARIGICSKEHSPDEDALHAMLAEMWPYLEVDFEKRGILPPLLDDSGWAWVPIDMIEQEFKEAKEFLTEKPWRN